MTRKQFQLKINRAQYLKKKAYYQDEAVKNGALPATIRNAKVANRALDSYEKIYRELVGVAKLNNWSITEFETNDFFDYETFDYE